MKKKGQLSLGMIVMIFTVIIVGVALIVPIFNTQSQMTSTQPVTDESDNLVTSCYVGLQVNESDSNCNITVSKWYATGDWKASEPQCYLTSVTVTNATGTALVLSTDYNLYASTGIIQMLNTTSTASAGLGNVTLTDYNYCAEGYNKDSSSRTIAALIGLFAVIALMAYTLPGVRNWILDR